MEKNADGIVVQIDNRAGGIWKKMLACAKIIEAHISDVPTTPDIVALLNPKFSILKKNTVVRYKAVGRATFPFEYSPYAATRSDKHAFHAMRECSTRLVLQPLLVLPSKSFVIGTPFFQKSEGQITPG